MEDFEDISVGKPIWLEDGEYDAEGYRIVVKGGIVVDIHEG